MTELDLTAIRDDIRECRGHAIAYSLETLTALLDRIDELSGDLNTAMQEHAHWQERAEKAERELDAAYRQIEARSGQTAAERLLIERTEKAERELAELRAGRGKWKGADHA